jgi:hypothetical protein
VPSFLNRPLAALAQGREERKERHKGFFLALQANQNHFSFGTLAFLAVQAFLTTRLRALVIIAKNPISMSFRFGPILAFVIRFLIDWEPS